MLFFGKSTPVVAQENDVDEWQRQALKLWPDAALLIVDGSIVLANPAAARLIGTRSDADLINRPVKNILAPTQPAGSDRDDLVKQLTTHSASQGDIRLRCLLQRDDGGAVQSRILMVRVAHPTKRITFAIIEDITQWLNEQNRTEAATRVLSANGTVSTVSAKLEDASKSLAIEGGVMSAGAQKTKAELALANRTAVEATQNAREIATAGEHLSSTVARIEERLRASERTTSDAVVEAEKVSAIVSTLSEAAGKIDDVVQLINTIAGQTNLLALNATIEAARAGEAGRGFAVVANEVKALANQTAKATEDIQKQIGNVQAASRSSVQAIGRISDIIDGISRDSHEISGAVVEQSTATNSIVRGIHQTLAQSEALVRALEGIDKLVESNQRSAALVNDKTAELQDNASKLAADVRRLALG